MRENDPNRILGFQKGPGVDFENFRERTIGELTDCPAPHISGLYSLQAVARNKEDPDVTVYGQHASEVLEWSSQGCHEDRVSWFLLRDANNEEWSVYDADGFLSGFCNGAAGAADDCERESDRVVSVSKVQFTEDARKMVGDDDLSLLACLEDHVGASAADHSNFVEVMRRMILEASADDLKRVYMVESKRWPCQVVGVFANVSKLSAERQDVYLDRFKWINSGWPLGTVHHLYTLADRLATRRHEYVRELLRTAGRGAGLNNELQSTLIADWELANPESKYQFARHLVEVLKEGLRFKKGAPEVFDPDFVERHGGEVVKECRERLR